LKAQTDANQRAFDDILSSAGVSRSSSAAVTYFDLGSVHIRLPYTALARLYENADPRILSIGLNRPVAWPTLTNSTVLLNMQPTWSLGYRAAGQNIMVIDSGVRKDHELFKINGATKVIYEACFGSNVSSGGILYSSICPNQDVNGDSPLGQLGSGEPFSDLTTCASLLALDHDCSHGTHVAGIAAGHSSPNVFPSNLQGVAPDAGLISAQVFSYNTTSPAASAFGSDILAALNALNAATTPGTNNPYVVNMSIGVLCGLPDCFSRCYGCHPELDISWGSNNNRLRKQGEPERDQLARLRPSGYKGKLGSQRFSGHNPCWVLEHWCTRKLRRTDFTGPGRWRRYID